MGIVYAEITLRNSADLAMVKRGVMNESEIREKTVTAMVDTGAATLVINEDVRRHLGLGVEKTYRATLADGTKQVYSTTEPVQIQWKDREHVCQAILIPSADDILLGAIPLEGMDLVINPLKQELTGAHGDTVFFRI